ncbi:MAG: glutamine-hydrolyzing GMP synthase [Erysipelotrichaceae bacterium]
MEKILVVNYGSQFNQLIARRVREFGVYSEIVDFDTPIEVYADPDVKGIILSGGPNSVYDQGAPSIDKKIFDLGKPILGICYGMQITQYALGGVIESSDKREYGKSTLTTIKASNILAGVEEESIVWMSHGDHVTKLAEGFEKLAYTDTCIAVAVNQEKNIYNVQFHPEVTHSEYGAKMIENFVNICETKRTWTMHNYIEKTIKEIQAEVKDKKVILGLSGGVDSSVVAMLVHRAIGDNLTCIFVDTGLLRKAEGDKVMEVYGNHYQMRIQRVNAQNLFLDGLKGVKDPETKRKIIGKLFVQVFEQAKAEQQDAEYLAQGTIYPDVIESSTKGAGATIKSHHNVGGLPEKLNFKLLEPLKDLFKDEVRKVGIELGMPFELVNRHPFPGPGLGIRVIEEVTREKVKILQEADDIFISELIENNLYHQSSQAYVALLPCKTVGVMGDGRTYEYVCAIRSVNTQDFMTATFTRLPYEFLDKVATRIVNEVAGINRVVYDITSKPPGTIEWE